MPIIRLDNRATCFWDSLPHDALVIRLEELLSSEDPFKEVKDKGIRDLLNLDGKIMASSIMPDELLDCLTGKKYVELLNAIRPEAAMAPGCCAYIDDPLAASGPAVQARRQGPARG